MTRALILAAGQGTRLRPHTDNMPKCLVPLLGKPLLEWQAETLRSANITDIHIAAGYKAECIEALGFATTLNPHYASTNMVESLFNAKPYILADTTQDLLICYGDIVYQRNNLDTLLSATGDMSLMIDKQWQRYWSLRAENPLDDAETLVLDPTNCITEIGQKPQDYSRIHGQYTGLIKIPAARIKDFVAFYDALDRTAQYNGRPFTSMYMTDFIQNLINANWRVQAAFVNNGWLEVDTVGDLALYQDMQSQGTLAQFYDITKTCVS